MTGPIQFKPWIYEIAKNACIDEYRRSRRAHEVSLDVDEDAGGPRPPLSLAPTPPAAVEAKQSLLDLQGAFGGLSESHHQLLVLRELEGLSYDEIGARTGMSRQMVESALFRARRKLTEEYNELTSGRRCQQVQGAIEDGRVTTLESLGIRERRQFARHLAHCQPCRITAHMAGVDQSLVKPRRIAAKIAAFLPFPALALALAGRPRRSQRRGSPHGASFRPERGHAQRAGRRFRVGRGRCRRNRAGAGRRRCRPGSRRLKSSSRHRCPPVTAAGFRSPERGLTGIGVNRLGRGCPYRERGARAQGRGARNPEARDPRRPHIDARVTPAQPNRSAG